MIAWWKIPISPHPTQSNQPSQKPKWVGETEIPPNWTQKRPHWHSLKINGCVTHGNFYETKFSELKLSAVYRKSGLQKKKKFLFLSLYAFKVPRCFRFLLGNQYIFRYFYICLFVSFVRADSLHFIQFFFVVKFFVRSSPVIGMFLVFVCLFVWLIAACYRH